MATSIRLGLMSQTKKVSLLVCFPTPRLYPGTVGMKRLAIAPQRLVKAHVERGVSESPMTWEPKVQRSSQSSSFGSSASSAKLRTSFGRKAGD